MRTILLTTILAAVAPLAVAVDANAPAPVPAGAYTVDKAHTSLLFRVSHMGFSHWTGRFTQVDAQLQFDPANIAASQVTVNIDPRSISADNAPSGFLQTLAGAGWLDADHFPQMKFVSKSVDVTGAGTANGTAVQIWTCSGGTNQQWRRS